MAAAAFGQSNNMSSSSDITEEQRLRREFRVIDVNGDGKVDKDEMNEFLRGRGIDDEHRTQIVDELFSKCDSDGNNRIELDEFVGHYI